MIIVNNEIDVAIVESNMELAKQQFHTLSKSLSKEDITRISENMAEDEPELAIALGTINEEMQLDEFMVKHVSSRGEITKTKDLKTRQLRATQTTGLSKAARRQIAKKAQKTKKSNPGIGRRAVRKTKRAKMKRKAYGLDNNE